MAIGKNISRKPVMLLGLAAILCLAIIYIIRSTYSRKKQLNLPTLSNNNNNNNNITEPFQLPPVTDKGGLAPTDPDKGGLAPTVPDKGGASPPVIDQQNTVNAVRDDISSIMSALSPIYALPQKSINAYGFSESNPDSPLKLDDLGNLSAEFQLNFIQQIQDAEINELQSRLSKLPIKSKLDNGSSAGHVKHLSTGKVYNLLKSADQIGDQFGFITDSQNAVCLKHVNDPAGNTADLTACDYNYNAPGQKFLLETVTSNDTFNDMLDPDRKPEIYNKYKVDPMFGYGTYPFSVIKTAELGENGLYQRGNECITLDGSGLSVEPCTGKDTQRFMPFNN